MIVPYRDDARNWIAYDKIGKENPSSVLHIGCGPGYVLRRLERYCQTPCRGLTSHKADWLTRTTEAVRVWDQHAMPWPIGDSEFDLCVTDGFLNGSSESLLLTQFASEVNRTCRRGVHAIDFGDHPELLGKYKDLFGPNHRFESQNWFWDGEVLVKFDGGHVKVACSFGPTMFAFGWFNVDDLPLTERGKANKVTYWRHDFRNPMPSADNRVTALTVAHTLNFLDRAAGLNFLEECWRILSPGGTLRLAVFDRNKATATLDDYAIDSFVDDGGYWRARIAGFLSGEWTCPWDETALADVLREVGFCKVKRMPFNVTGCNYIAKETFDILPDGSFYLECRKLVL